MKNRSYISFYKHSAFLGEIYEENLSFSVSYYLTPRALNIIKLNDQIKKKYFFNNGGIYENAKCGQNHILSEHT